MSEKFQEQGGAATMDPGNFRRWLTSRVMTARLRPGRLDKAQARAERARKKAGLPHRLDYFHQVDDAYSHLAAQALRSLIETYDVELVPHLVRGPGGDNLPEPDLLPAQARYDAALVAPHYGLSYPTGAHAPSSALLAKAQCVLSAVEANQFPEAAVAVGSAMLEGDSAVLDELAGLYGSVSADQAELALEAGTATRNSLGHYGGAMFHYGGQWYWGVDRLHLLERRWRDLGLGDGDTLFPRPPIESGSYTDNGSLTLEIYASVRSPYTAVIFDRAVQLAERSGVNLELRPVLPMVMRGVSLTREKGLYILDDAAREARALGKDFGKIYDPIGEPARRLYSLLSWAEAQGKQVSLMSEFLNAAWCLGVNTNRDAGLQFVVEKAGLSWQEAKQVIDNQDWQAELETNRRLMYGFGAWGVPTFRLLDATGNTVVWAWGQDRLWLIAREIQRVLIQA